MKKIIYSLLFIAFIHNVTYAQCSPVWPNSLTASANAAPVGSTVTLSAIYTSPPPFNVNHRYQWVDISATGENCGSTNILFGPETFGVAFEQTSPPLVAGNNIFTLRFNCFTGVQCNPPLQVVVVGIGSMGVDDFNTGNNVKIYPNPASDHFIIDMESEVKSVEIYSIQGQKVMSASDKNVSVSNLSKGMYLVRIEDENKAVSTQKLIVK